MLKINDAMDKNYKEKSDKEPGFSRLEEHRKNLILNTSAVPPYDNPASQPTEFFMTFLAKKSQFKAKDMILHRLQSDKISFNPGSSFINSLWNCDFSGFCQIGHQERASSSAWKLSQLVHQTSKKIAC
jgi:hypothetical protein